MTERQKQEQGKLRNKMVQYFEKLNPNNMLTEDELINYDNTYRIVYSSEEEFLHWVKKLFNRYRNCNLRKISVRTQRKPYHFDFNSYQQLIDEINIVMNGVIIRAEDYSTVKAAKALSRILKNENLYYML